MAEKNNGQAIVAHYLNDFLTTTYPTDYEVTDRGNGRPTAFSYIGFEPEYIARHKNFMEKEIDAHVLVLEFFVPSWFLSNYGWVVSLHSGVCALVIKGLDKHHSYCLSKEEAPPAMAYAREKMRLLDRRFGQSVDFTHPEALKLIEAAKAKSPQQADALVKKNSIITELRKLKTFSGPKAPVIDFPIRKS